MTRKTFKQLIDWVMPIKVANLPALHIKESTPKTNTTKQRQQDLLYHQNEQVKCSACKADETPHQWLLN